MRVLSGRPGLRSLNRLFNSRSTLPTIIETEEQNERLLAVAEKLMDRGKQRTVEETALLNLLVHLIQNYEQKAYQPEMATPHEALRELIQARD